MLSCFFFFFKQKTAYEVLRSLVGSEMCIRDSADTDTAAVVARSRRTDAGLRFGHGLQCPARHYVRSGHLRVHRSRTREARACKAPSHTRRHCCCQRLGSVVLSEAGRTARRRNRGDGRPLRHRFGAISGNRKGRNTRGKRRPACDWVVGPSRVRRICCQGDQRVDDRPG
mgnify:CR=1 FL=1